MRLDPGAYRHDLCVEHVEVEGLTEPVCILKSDDREEVLRMVEEVMGRVRLGLAPRRRPTPGKDRKGDKDSDGDAEQDGDDANRYLGRDGKDNEHARVS